MKIEIISLILSILTSAGLTPLVTLKSVKKKAAEGAESLAIDNDSKRVEGYIIIIDDLNKRIATALETMRKLESELNYSKIKITNLETENKQLKAENYRLKQLVKKR